MVRSIIICLFKQYVTQKSTLGLRGIVIYEWSFMHDLVTLPNIGKHLALSQYAISSRSNRPNSRNGQKPLLVLWIIQNCFFFWMVLHDLVMLPNVGKHLVISKYAISSQFNRPNSRKWPKTSFLAFWIIQKCIFVTFDLNDPSWPGNIAKMLENIYISQYAISSRSIRPNSRKWPKPSFMDLWIIQKCIFLIFEWSSMSHIIAKLLRPFSIIKICNIKLIRWTKLKKMANNWITGWIIHNGLHNARKKILKNQQGFSWTCGFRGFSKKSCSIIKSSFWEYR